MTPSERVPVAPVSARDPATRLLVEALTAELAAEGYTADETFGYSLDLLEERGVLLRGAWQEGELVAIGGLEVGGSRDGAPPGAGTVGELKRFYVRPDRRGGGLADAVLGALLDEARARGVGEVRLETGDRQHAAIAFYRRHGFRVVPRFGPYVASATSVCMARPLYR